MLRWISDQSEKTFREFANKRYGNHKGNEKRAFQDLMGFIKSEFGQESFHKWELEQTQKDPI